MYDKWKNKYELETQLEILINHVLFRKIKPEFIEDVYTLNECPKDIDE